MEAILNKAETLKKATNSSCDVFWHMPYMDFTI